MVAGSSASFRSKGNEYESFYHRDVIVDTRTDSK